MNKQEERRRLINMRECLRQAQQHLTTTYNEYVRSDKQQYICTAAEKTDCGRQAIDDTRNLIMRAITPYMSYEGWHLAHHKYRRPSFEQLMALRKKWVDQLCRDINKRLHQL